MRVLSLISSSYFSNIEFPFFTKFRSICAFSTCSSAVMTGSILFSIFMTSNTMSLPGLDSHKAITSKYVFSMRDCFKVVGVYADFIFTKVINVISGWNGTFFNLVANFIGLCDLSLCSWNVKDPVSLTIGTCLPYPTRFSFFNFDPVVCHRADSNVTVLKRSNIKWH